MKPISSISPPDNGRNFSIKLPTAGCVSGVDKPVVPGFIYVQVLARGQPASASEFHRVLVLDSNEMMRELDALLQGKANEARDDGREDESCCFVVPFILSRRRNF
jgi:hypothetical protein